MIESCENGNTNQEDSSAAALSMCKRTHFGELLLADKPGVAALPILYPKAKGIGE